MWHRPQIFMGSYNIMRGGTRSPYRHDRSYQLSARSMLEGQVASPLGKMESLATLGALSGLPIEYGQGLEEIGWNVQRLGTLHDEEEAVIGEVLISLEDKVGRPLEVEPLLGLIEVAHRAAEVSWRVEGGTSGAELLVASEMRKLQDKMNEWRAISIKKLVEEVPKRGTAKVARWPSRLQKKMNAAGEDQSLREKAEKDERFRWIRELKKQLEHPGWRLSSCRCVGTVLRSVEEVWEGAQGQHSAQAREDLGEVELLGPCNFPASMAAGGRRICGLPGKPGR